MGFFIETLLGGLMTGVLYALIALGFVLIFKASGVFNFAQGIMMVFAALTLVGLYSMLRGWGVAPGDLAAYLALALRRSLARRSRPAEQRTRAAGLTAFVECEP